LRWLVLGLLLSTLILVSFASTVSVSAVKDQVRSGFLTYVFFETVSGPSSTTPSDNTQLTPSGAATSYAVASGATAYLWSPQSPIAETISAGTWVLDIWASGSLAGKTLTISIFTTTSTGTTQSTVVTGSTQTLTTTKAQYVKTFAGAAATVPVNGYVKVAIATSAGGTTTIYWGTGEYTNFQVPYRTLTS
jgi:hypothetical protein